MPKLTYKALRPDDPVFTRVGSYSFENGKAVDVDQETYDNLKDNPWFGGGSASDRKDAAAAAGATMAPGPDSGIDSSVMPAYPPGGGMKYAPEAVKTEAGMVPADDADTDEDIGDFQIKHKGRGVYDVLRGGEVVTGGLSKADAEDYVRARTV
ncbi:hypothetical protein VQ02_17345 [Methylobacterium variabile]|jgi:hypothetical protein|uniref:Uncharacterized protein n=1 Tax=Methylobacterium variabile TaxID=298794 RepID=A0A0J6SPZ2_9HYPH|nr:hypothetical protein [Methylobacterium variabile]KMO35448.1 hypothetical protein VQ02_17345 [Methylobacterium variabile]